MRVFINPGHAPQGNPDPGCVNPNNGMRECDIALEIGNMVAKYLSNVGLEVKVMQSDWLNAITMASNEWESDVFVSIHCNGSANHNARGAETWYFYKSKNGSRLADCIQDELMEEFEYELHDRGTKGAIPGTNGLYVLTNTVAPAVLVELAFIDNDEDAAILKKDGDKFARAIARGVTDYLQAR